MSASQPESESGRTAVQRVRSAPVVVKVAVFLAVVALALLPFALNNTVASAVGLAFVALAVLSVVFAAAVEIMDSAPRQGRRAEGFGVGSAILSIVAVVVLIVGHNNNGSSNSNSGQVPDKALRQTERKLDRCEAARKPLKACLRSFGVRK